MDDLRGRYDKMQALPPTRRSDQRILHTVAFPPCSLSLQFNNIVMALDKVVLFLPFRFFSFRL